MRCIRDNQQRFGKQSLNFRDCDNMFLTLRAISRVLGGGRRARPRDSKSEELLARQRGSGSLDGYVASRDWIRFPLFLLFSAPRRRQPSTEVVNGSDAVKRALATGGTGSRVLTRARRGSTGSVRPLLVARGGALVA